MTCPRNVLRRWCLDAADLVTEGSRRRQGVVMIQRIEALNYRCLRYVDQQLADFQILVGPNASGKTVFLDVVAFLGDLVTGGLDQAVEERTHDFRDLMWQRSGARVELAIELVIPAERREVSKAAPYHIVRYEVAIGHEKEGSEPAILSERVLLKTDNPLQHIQLGFPRQRLTPKTLTSPPRVKNTRTVVNKVRGGNDNYYSEVYPVAGKGWVPSFKLGPRRSALGNLPADEHKFPVSTWLQGLLTKGVQKIGLNSLLMRKASPPAPGRKLKSDGSNLPWVVESFKRTSPDAFSAWLAHVRKALPDIRNLRTVERPDDEHRYLIVEYAGDLHVPSWLVSDGTLRLLALTILAYLPEFTGICLIEEPENGIHPRAVETLFQSLSSVHSAQILLTTHSPVVLSVARPHQVLCFVRSCSGTVDVVPGTGHPALRDWQNAVDLGVLFAGDLLG